MNIGIVTCGEMAGLTQSEQGLLPIFHDRGIRAIPLIWDDETVDWASYDYLILRTVWDSHLKSVLFNKWLDNLDVLGVNILNPTRIIKKNHHKFYLKELEKEGFRIIPTLFIDKTENLDLSSIHSFGWKKAVIKPAISASSYLTELFEARDLEDVEKRYKLIATQRDLLVQSFMPEIQEYGELSIMFFNRRYSHTVLKSAQQNEFRVQSEYGGSTTLIEPHPHIIEYAHSILSSFQGKILYARVDGIIRNRQFVLMEIELIEPELFLDFHIDAKFRFVEAAIQLMQ